MPEYTIYVHQSILAFLLALTIFLTIKMVIGLVK